MKGKIVYIVGENGREPKGDSDKTFILRERGETKDAVFRFRCKGVEKWRWHLYSQI